MGLFNKDKENNASTEDAQNEKKHSGRGSVISSASLLKREAVVTKKDSDNIPQTVTDAKFSDLYITPDKKCYVWSGKSNSGLKVANYIDLHEFMNEVVSKYDGSMSSYSLKYKDRYYRVERTIALEGEQFCVRKMPISIPDLEKLGLPRGVFNQLMQFGHKIDWFAKLSNSNVIIESIKKAEYSDSVIIRMYESKGETAETALEFNREIKSAHIVDLTENNETAVNLDSIKLGRFEIVTIKVEL
jgi:hypothetical protein